MFLKRFPCRIHSNSFSGISLWLFLSFAEKQISNQKEPGIWKKLDHGLSKTATFRSPQIKRKRAVSNEQKMKETIREVCVSYQPIRGSFITTWNDSCTNAEETSFRPDPLLVLTYCSGVVWNLMVWILSKCWSLFAYEAICSADHFVRFLPMRLKWLCPSYIILCWCCQWMSVWNLEKSNLCLIWPEKWPDIVKLSTTCYNST